MLHADILMFYYIKLPTHFSHPTSFIIFIYSCQQYSGGMKIMIQFKPV